MVLLLSAWIEILRCTMTFQLLASSQYHESFKVISGTCMSLCLSVWKMALFVTLIFCTMIKCVVEYVLWEY